MTSVHDQINETAVRRTLTSAAGDADPLVADDEISDVVIEGDWVAVVLAVEDPQRELLQRTHAALEAALPGARVEVRAQNRIYRGGAGFGRGRHVLAVLGGKGGVGKSTVAANLALTLSAMGLRVGLVDADINAPDIPHMLGVHPAEPSKSGGLRVRPRHVPPPSQWRHPHKRYEIEVMSVGFEVPEGFPPRITSRPLVSMLLRHLIFEVAWSAEVLIVDAPPGTGEELQTIAAELPLSGALFVTTPQDLAQMDAERTLRLLAEHNVPIIGLVKNMASLTCPHCQQEIDLFSESRRLADAGVTLLGAIPFDVGLSEAADRGEPLVLGEPNGPLAYEFARIGSSVRRWLADAESAVTPPGTSS